MLKKQWCNQSRIHSLGTIDTNILIFLVKAIAHILQHLQLNLTKKFKGRSKRILSIQTGREGKSSRKRRLVLCFEGKKKKRKKERNECNKTQDGVNSCIPRRTRRRVVGLCGNFLVFKFLAFLFWRALVVSSYLSSNRFGATEGRFPRP